MLSVVPEVYSFSPVTVLQNLLSFSSHFITDMKHCLAVFDNMMWTVPARNFHTSIDRFPMSQFRQTISFNQKHLNDCHYKYTLTKQLFQWFGRGVFDTLKHGLDSCQFSSMNNTFSY